MGACSSRVDSRTVPVGCLARDVQDELRGIPVAAAEASGAGQAARAAAALNRADRTLLRVAVRAVERIEPHGALLHVAVLEGDSDGTSGVRCSRVWEGDEQPAK